MEDKSSSEVVIATRDDLKYTLKSSSAEYTMLKFHADWCAPCKGIAPLVHDLVVEKTKDIGSKFQYIEVNVDDSFDVYAFLKSKKMTKGIPTILVYKKSEYSDSTFYIPFMGVTGAKKEDIKNMFDEIN